MERILEEFSGSNTGAYDERHFEPVVDWTETEHEFVMSVDLPGVKKDDVKIEVQGNTLLLSGERKKEMSADKKAKYQTYERSYGFFQRRFTLPTTVDADKIEARFEDGVLELMFPKTESAKPRKVEIQSGKSGGFFNKILSPNEKTSDKNETAQDKQASHIQ